MAIKRIKEITTEDENFRIENVQGFHMIRRDPVEQVPVGTLIAKVFRVIGYDKDCDGSLMARIECVDKDGDTTGWEQDCVGLDTESTWEIDSADDLDKLAR